MYRAVILLAVVLVPVLGLVLPDHDHPGLEPGHDQCGKRKTDISLIQTHVIGGGEVPRGFSPWSVLLGYRV